MRRKLIFEKSQKKGVVSHFLENFDQKTKNRVFSRTPIEKFLGSVSNYEYLKNVHKGDPSGRQGVASVRKKSVPPKSATEQYDDSFKNFK